MNIVFRTDASINIGTGHVMRCLTLADALREQRATCTFICRPHAGHLLDLITQRGHRAVALPATEADASPLKAISSPSHAHWLGTDWVADAADTRKALENESVDWLVVDHYALDVRWEQAVRPACRRIMVIDDLADRPHDCDLLLDQNLGRMAEDYSGLAPANATRLIGPQYALLRPEFAQLRAESLARRAQPKLQHLLITMGGVDKDNATGQVLDALKACPLPEGLEITAVMGPHAPWLEHVQAQALKMPWATEVLVGVSNMAQLMADSDLVIGAAGSTSWERCCLGVPTIQMILALNQIDIAKALSDAGAAQFFDAHDLKEKLLTVFSDQTNIEDLLSQTKAASQVCDGRGAKRVANHLMNDPMKITLLCSDENHPVNTYLQDWMCNLRGAYEVELIRKKTEAEGGDILFLVSCGEIITSVDRAKYKACLVLHASDLPKGRGWSPHIWELSNGAESITLSLLEAGDKVDSGDIWKKVHIPVPKHALWDEINHLLFLAEVDLINFAVENFDAITPQQQSDDLPPTYYRLRNKQDSQIDPMKSVAEQFDLIRVCDPNRFPAYFEHLGQRYLLKLEKCHDH